VLVQCASLVELLDMDVPIHFTAFHPDFKDDDVAATRPPKRAIVRGSKPSDAAFGTCVAPIFTTLRDTARSPAGAASS
jgi:hypothetical protein